MTHAVWPSRAAGGLPCTGGLDHEMLSNKNSAKMINYYSLGQKQFMHDDI